MHKDEIIDELRKERKAYAAQFNFDIHKIVVDLTKSEKARKEVKKILPPRAIQKHRLQNIG